MKAVDTNILVRWITRDDPIQTALADAVMRLPVSISHTVLIELVWTLSGKTYRFVRADTADILYTLLDLATATVPLEREVRWAIERFADGADFADMIHVVGARDAAAFVSFDRSLAFKAGRETPTPIEILS